MMQHTTILELMSDSGIPHDLEWLKRSLQAAITLEFATIPPYLAAYWSIKNGTDPVARSIRTIFLEEMLHMGLACNLLVAIGGHPILNTTDAIPTYPGPLPGGVHPGLEVSLRGLSKDAVKTFMDIEYPAWTPVALESVESYPTIGEFYDAIFGAFESLQPTLAVEPQVKGPLGLKKLQTLEQVRQAIQLIKHQGEGSKESPEDTGMTDLAHYYRFGEIYHEKRLRKDPATGVYHFNGEPVPFPEVRPMAAVPAGGYRQNDVTAQVWELLMAFDTLFTTTVNQLHAAWNGSADSLGDAVDSMYSMGDPAVSLMEIEIPGGHGNYGPCFRLISI